MAATMSLSMYKSWISGVVSLSILLVLSVLVYNKVPASQTPTYKIVGPIYEAIPISKTRIGEIRKHVAIGGSSQQHLEADKGLEVELPPARILPVNRSVTKLVSK